MSDRGPGAVDDEATAGPLVDGPGGPPDPPGTAPPEPRRTRVRFLAAVAAVCFAAAVALGAVAASLAGELEDEREGRRDVERAASTFAQRLLTFDHRRLEEARDAVFALSTGRFQKEYERAFKGLAELIATGETVQRATVTDVFVSGADSATASAIVVVDLATTGRAGPRNSFDSYIELDLVRVGARWLVDGVTNLNFTGGGGTSPAPPTTTTAPDE